MHNESFTWISVFALAGALCTTACDGSDADDGATDGDTEADSSEDLACDPGGPNPEQAALFNAPLEPDVEVVEKTPTHPGEPGPENLP